MWHMTAWSCGGMCGGTAGQAGTGGRYGTHTHIHGSIANLTRLPAPSHCFLGALKTPPFPLARLPATYLPAPPSGPPCQAYSPLSKGHKLSDPRVAGVAARLGVTPAQVMIRCAGTRIGDVGNAPSVSSVTGGKE